MAHLKTLLFGKVLLMGNIRLTFIANPCFAQLIRIKRFESLYGWALLLLRLKCFVGNL